MDGPEALSPGKHTLEYDFKYDGLGAATLAFNSVSGLGRSGTGVLKVDGKEVATIKLPKTIPLTLQWDENFDVGADTLTGSGRPGLPGAVPLHRQARRS